jgi:hypothetical protein
MAECGVAVPFDLSVWRLDGRITQYGLVVSTGSIDGQWNVEATSTYSQKVDETGKLQIKSSLLG